MECIIIDDGSTDGTRGICGQFTAADSRFRLISKANTGVSDSRNEGLAAASGDYVFFLDADDYLDTAWWREILDRAAEGDFDMIAYGYYDLFESGEKKKEQFPKGCDIKRALLSTTLMNVCWSKLLRRETITKNGLAFRKELKTCEDAVFILDFARKAEKFLLSDVCLVYYRIHAGGIMKVTGLESKASDLGALFDSRKGYLAENYDESLSIAMYRQFFSIITDLLRGYAGNRRIRDIGSMYKSCMDNDAIKGAMNEVRKGYLSPFYKRIEYALLQRGCYSCLGAYFKVKLRFSIERRR